MAEIKLVSGDKPNFTAKLLRAVSVGVVIPSAVIAPNILSLLAASVKGDSDREGMLRAARYAKERGWVTFRETPRGVEVALTEGGRIKWSAIELSQPLFERRWDKKWRFVIFDIPVSHRYKADTLRHALRQLGMKQYQRSIWVTPYKCQTQVALLRQLYGLKRYVQIIEASAIENEASLKYKFNL